MKNLKSLFLLMFLIIQFNLYAENYALFIHGFGGDEGSWANSGTIAELKEVGIIKDAINKNYIESQVEDESYIQNTFITPMIIMGGSPNDKWVIIGHSMGGLLARALEQSLQNSSINVVGVLTISTPHQGARVAHASLSVSATQSIHGQYNPAPIMADFKNKIQNAFDNRSSRVDFFASIYYWEDIWSSILWDSDDCDICKLYALPQYLDEAWKFAEDYIALAEISNAFQLIGTNGSIIKDINSIATQAQYRSVMGAERYPVSMRFGSTFNEVSGSTNEDEMYDAYIGAKDYMWATYEYYKALAITNNILLCIPSFGFACESTYRARRRRDKWDKAIKAWDDIDSYWGQAINSYEVTQAYITSYNLKCEDIYGYYGGGDADEDFADYDWDIYFRETACTGVWEDDWAKERTYYDVITATKNDGLIRPQEARWNKNDSWIPDNHIAMHAQNNYYYGDKDIDERGYNHNELRDFKRKYSPRKGGKSVPWRDIQSWLENEVLN